VTETRRGRPPQRFAIRRVRLVGFHNFVDETIEIRDSGHLFLLGDNGSGKTTVLDAIHIVLTGALNIELNAAARVAGGREAGRTLQGIVLRHDAERGVLNEGGGIAYALLELHCDEDDAVHVVGIGIEATTMDADVARWGIVTKGRLEDVPVVDHMLDGRRALTRDELRAKLGKVDVMGRMSDFRKTLADRFFKDIELYEEVCRFWSMAKAYREIVTKARDFAGLFARLLPAPNRSTFTDILHSARALDELEGTLGQLEEQKAYVARINERVKTIMLLRETIARYRWLAAFRRKTELEDKLQTTQLELRARRAQERRAEATVENAVVAVTEATDALARLRTSDAAGILAHLQEAMKALARAKATSAIVEAELVEAENSAIDARKPLDLAHVDYKRIFGKLVAEARTYVDKVQTLDAPMKQTAHALALEDARVSGDPVDAALATIDQATIQEVELGLSAAASAAKEREKTVREAEQRVRMLKDELASLETRREELPHVSGFVAARKALTDAEIVARPLYELLEPKPAAAGASLAAIEVMVSDEQLAAFVVPEVDRERAAALVLPHHGARVLARVAVDGALAGWARELFSSKSDATALDALATLLAQPRSLGDPASPNALGDIEHRGETVRVHREAPRLLGEAARRRAHETRLRKARGEVTEAEEILGRSVASSEQAASRVDAFEQLRAAMDALRNQAPVEAHANVRVAIKEYTRAQSMRDTVRVRVADAQGKVKEAERLLQTLQARARDEGLDELERMLAGLKSKETAARESERAASVELGVLKASIASLEQEERSEVDQLAVLVQQLERFSVALRERLEKQFDDAALEHYVRVIQRGDQFKSVASIEERLKSTEQEEYGACQELNGDGSSGVRNLQWAGRFGFSWEAETCRVADRRGEPLANILAHIEKDIAEQREVVNEKTRDLMDKLVMGALARELQEHIERLNRTVLSMNGLLDELRFGTTRYQFKVTPHDDRKELVTQIRKVSLVNEESRVWFRQFISDRLDEIKRLDDESDIPDLLDYRRWYDYRLSMRTTGQDDTELTRELRSLGSGGEQGVPNYLLVLALARLMFDNADARLRPILFDEAFYGIDAGRRDQLLRFATDLGLQLVVASPDQDGVTPSVKRTTTLFIVKDENLDVHLAPYHYWNDTRLAQPSLLSPSEPSLEEAMCVVSPSVEARRKQ